VVDNAFATPALQRPLEFGADIVAYSATKMMDGQGRVLAGAVTGTEDFINNTLLPFTRNTGPTLSGVQCLGGAEGAGDARPAHPPPERECAQGRRFLEKRVPKINFPALPSHPQHNLFMRQMDDAGPIFSFEVEAAASRRMACSTHSSLIDISNNIGDSRSLMTHPSSTTHSGVAEEKRMEMGVTEGMLRLNVGLEDPDDLIADLDQALRRAVSDAVMKACSPTRPRRAASSSACRCPICPNSPSRSAAAGSGPIISASRMTGRSPCNCSPATGSSPTGAARAIRWKAKASSASSR
jgi:O-succinylhomoserine sulfhydrylase